MKNKTIIILAVAVVLFAGFVLLNKSQKTNFQEQIQYTASSSPEVATSTLSASSTKKQLPTLQDRIWSLFGTYIVKAKTHDIEGVKNLSYQQSAACGDPKRVNECYGLMDIVVGLAKGVKKEEYVNLWNDSKQIILSTNFNKIDTVDTYGYSHGYLVLTVDAQGELKMLNFNPNRSWFYTKNESEFGNREVMEAKLSQMIRDSDEDGLTDNQEVCGGDYQGSTECTNTDPKKKDSDGDNWWDGVEFFFYKK